VTSFNNEAEITTVQGNPVMTCAASRRVTGAGVDGSALKVALVRAEREAVEQVLKQTKGNVAEAAAVLGIVRTSLYRIMKRYGIVTPGQIRPKDQTLRITHNT